MVGAIIMAEGVLDNQLLLAEVFSNDGGNSNSYDLAAGLWNEYGGKFISMP
jgi:hypothetical protein